MGNRWKDEISRTILNIFPPYNGIDVLKLPFLEELYEKTFVVPYVYLIYDIETCLWLQKLILGWLFLPRSGMIFIHYASEFMGRVSSPQPLKMSACVK